MAIRRWIGVVSEDLNVAGNYDDGNGGAGAVPVNGDDLLFTIGIVPVTLNPAALAAVTLDSLVISSGYTGSLSVDGAPVELQATTVNIDGGPSTLHFLELSSTSTYVLDTGTSLELGGTIVNLYLHVGTINFDTLTIGTLLYIGQRPKVVIDAASTLNAAISQDGGTVTCSTTHGILTLTNGTWAQEDGNGTTVNLNGGTYQFSANTNVLTNAYVNAGYLDCSLDPHPKTITNATLTDRGRINLNNGAANITITNGILCSGSGAVNFSPGVTVDVS